VDRSGSDGVFDYYYERDINDGIIDKYGLQVLARYPLSTSYLAAPKTPD